MAAMLYGIGEHFVEEQAKVNNAFTSQPHLMDTVFEVEIILRNVFIQANDLLDISAQIDKVIVYIKVQVLVQCRYRLNLV